MVGDWERRGAEGEPTGLGFSHFFEKKQIFLNYHFKIIFGRVPSEMRGAKEGAEEEARRLEEGAMRGEGRGGG